MFYHELLSLVFDQPMQTTVHEVLMLKKKKKDAQKNYTKKISMTQITTMVWTLT